jgi:tetratricopeptide (TPR) repeat protein
MFMDSQSYAGRKVQKQILKSFLARAFGIAVPHGASADSPRLFLLHGDNGLGKTSLINICDECIEEIAAEGKPATSLILDLDAWRFHNGMVPNTIQAFLDALYAIAAGNHEQFGEALAPYESMNGRIRQAEAKKRDLVSLDWPSQVYLSDTPTGASDKTAADFAVWIAGRMDPADLALCDDRTGRLTESLAACLIKVSQSRPFALLFDSLDLLADSPAAGWLRTRFLPRLFSETNHLAVILACGDTLARSYRNEFADELVFPLSLASIPLTKNDIASLAAGRSVSLTPDQTVQLEQITAGIPIASRIALDAAALNMKPGSLFSKKSATVADADRLVTDCFDRFVKSLDNETDRTRIFFLAMLYRLDENILSQLWGISPEETTIALTDLALRYSFMEGRRIHEALHDRLRAFLMAEAVRGQESALAESFQKFSTVSAHIHRQYLAQMQTDTPDGQRRYADPNFQITLIGSLCAPLWARQADSAKALPGLFIEALHYNPDVANTLISFADDFKPLLSEEYIALLETLRSGLPVAKTLGMPLGPARRGALKALDFMKPYEADLSDPQQGLLSRMRGMLACQAGNHDKAMEAFNKCESLFGAMPLELSLLFENYRTVGFAFIAAGDMKKAAAALERAVAIRPDDFGARYRLALAEQSLGQHQNAIASLEEAVKIDPKAAFAWIELGNEYATTGDHGKAVEAFTRATELDAGRPVAWFKLGISLEAVSRFPEAEKALAKTVEILPEHWEAYFALGRSQSAQTLAQEAISSFNNVVELKPDCTAAWKALGKELYGVESYERAAAALEKSVELDPGDADMWDLLGKSWYGANAYEKAVAAAQKAVDLKNDFFNAWVTLGQSQTELSNFKEAHGAFARAAELDPKDGEIWVHVGNSLYAQGKYNDSITAYQKAVEFNPDVDSIWHNIGLAYQVQQLHAKAIEAFGKSVTINPGNADAWYQQGRSYAELSQYAEAAKSFSTAVELTPDAHDAWYRKGLSLSKTGDHGEAITTLIKASELNPTDADIWYQMGLSYVATGKAADAVSAFSQAITLAPNRPEVQFQLGCALESLSRFEEATVSYRKAIELSPEKVEAWQHLGLCYNFLSRYEDALPALRKVLELTPENTDLLLPIALAAHATNNFTDAVVFYRKVIALKPDSEEAMVNLALALHAMSNYAEALPAYHAVVKKWPGNDQAWYNMGLAYHAAGDFNQAVTAYREAARLNPDSSDVWYHMGLVFYATEHYGEAIQAFRKVISRAPDMYEAWFNIGNAYLVWNEYADAIEAYEKAVLLKPDDYSSWGYLGNAYFGSARYDKAVEACGKAFALKPDDPWIINSLALSRLLLGDAAGAGPLFDALRSADTGGQEIARAFNEIEKALSKNPALAGAQEILQKLSGEPEPASIEIPPDQDSPQ